MKDLRNIIEDNNQAVEKDTNGTTASNTDEVEDNVNTLVGRLVQVDQPLDDYAGMIGRVLKPSNLEDEVIVDFTDSPFVNAQVKGEWLDEVSEQVMDLFPLDELE